MADDIMVQLATRIPKKLHGDVKVFCVKQEVTLMDFVVRALQRLLAEEGKKAASKK